MTNFKPKTIDRIVLFINCLGISVRKFDIKIGASNGYTFRMRKNRASVGTDVIERICNEYPELNPCWILLGEGNMLRIPEDQEDSITEEDLKLLNFFLKINMRSLKTLIKLQK